MAIRKRLGALAMAAMLPVGGATLVSVLVISLATPAVAATPPCWDEGQHAGVPTCLGLDPQTTGCATDPQTYSVYTTPIRDSAGTQLGTVELRYSPWCGANWSRTRAFAQFAGVLSADIYNNLIPPPPNHEPTDFYSGTLAYSWMLGGFAESDYACGSILWAGGSGSACTPSG